MQKVNFHSATTKQNGMILILTVPTEPNAAVALSFENGMTEEMILDRVKNAFRTLAAGIAADKAA